MKNNKEKKIKIKNISIDERCRGGYNISNN